jgi:hypothetical protein
VHGSHDVDDERGPGVRPDRRDWNRRGLRGRACADEVPPAENEHDREKQRAGDESPARRREGVQHVVNCGNKGVTRGQPNWVETVSKSDVTNP